MADRVAIVGSRAHPNLDMVREYVRSLPPGTVVISGGAEGVDAVAVTEARARSLEWVVFLPLDAGGGTWSVYAEGQGHGPAGHEVWNFGSRRDALFFRNGLIVVDCTRLVAFPDGSKGGTWDAVKQAARFRRPVEERYADGRVVTRGGR